MFQSLNLTTKRIYENERMEAAFLLACGHLKNYIYYCKCINAVPGDAFYEENVDDCMLGHKYLEIQKNKSAKKCTRNLMILKAINGYLKSYNIKAENGYYEDQELVVTAFEEYLSDIHFSLEDRKFFSEANRLI